MLLMLMPVDPAKYTLVMHMEAQIIFSIILFGLYGKSINKE